MSRMTVMAIQVEGSDETLQSGIRAFHDAMQRATMGQALPAPTEPATPAPAALAQSSSPPPARLTAAPSPEAKVRKTRGPNKKKRGRPPNIARGGSPPAGGIQATYGRTPNGQLRKQVLEHIRKKGAGSAKEIGDALGVNPSYVSQKLSKLMADGAVQQIARGQYKADPDYEGD